MDQNVAPPSAAQPQTANSSKPPEDPYFKYYVIGGIVVALVIAGIIVAVIMSFQKRNATKRTTSPALIIDSSTDEEPAAQNQNGKPTAVPQNAGSAKLPDPELLPDSVKQQATFESPYASAKLPKNWSIETIPTNPGSAVKYSVVLASPPSNQILPGSNSNAPYASIGLRVTTTGAKAPPVTAQKLSDEKVTLDGIEATKTSYKKPPNSTAAYTMFVVSFKKGENMYDITVTGTGEPELQANQENELNLIISSMKIN